MCLQTPIKQEFQNDVIVPGDVEKHTLNNISRNAFRGENERDHVTIIDVTFASNPALLYFQTLSFTSFFMEKQPLTLSVGAGICIR